MAPAVPSPALRGKRPNPGPNPGLRLGLHHASDCSSNAVALVRHSPQNSGKKLGFRCAHIRVGNGHGNGNDAPLGTRAYLGSNRITPRSTELVCFGSNVRFPDDPLSRVWKPSLLAHTFFGTGLGHGVVLRTRVKRKLHITRMEASKNLEHYPKWPPNEDMASRRRRFGQNVVKMTSQAKTRRKAIQKGKFIPILNPPDNGLLVEKLIPVAHEVLTHRTKLFQNLPLLLKSHPSLSCSFCAEVFVGPRGHSITRCYGPGSHERHGMHIWIPATMEDVMPEMEVYHLADRLGRPVPHEHRLEVDAIPAVVELCIQAGIDIPEYPTVRRSKPVKDPRSVSRTQPFIPNLTSLKDQLQGSDTAPDSTTLGVPFTTVNQVFLGTTTNAPNETADLRLLAEETLAAWIGLREGVSKLMAKYPVKSCGYCTEVHVGPVGHKVRLCNASKHQWRNGQHGWQDAILDDIIPPKYVWHLKDRNKYALHPALRDFYGMAPAVVELCVQAGAQIPDQYLDTMRLDIVLPDVDEIPYVI